MATLRLFLIPFLITVLAVFQLGSGRRNSQQCGHGWKKFEHDSCVKQFSMAKTYADAQLYCQTQSATLVPIGSDAKTDIKKVAHAPYPYWVEAKEGFNFDQVKGYAKQGEWPMVLGFNLTGPGKGCVKITTDEVDSLQREACSKRLPFFCEVYVGNQGVCPKGWKLYYRENTCIGYLDRERIWLLGYLGCYAYGGHMVNLWNIEKQQLLLDLIPNRTKNAWIGMWTPKSNGVFKFFAGEKIKVIPPKVWELGDVVNGNGQCLAIAKLDRGLQRRDCELGYYVMCVKPMVKNSCPKHWDRLDDVKFCLIEHSSFKRTWMQAKRFCLNYYDAKLALVDSQRWYLYIKSKRAKPENEYWLFNNDMDQDGLWEWNYRQLPLPKMWDYDYMKRGKGNDPCMVIGHNEKGLEFDFCDAAHYYICSIPADNPERCSPPYFGYRGVDLCFREYVENVTALRGEFRCDEQIRGKLLEIKDQKMLTFVMAKVRTVFHKKYWVINRSVNTNLKWTEMVWESFFLPTPSVPVRINGRRENCVQFEADGELKRVGCTSRLYFICEKDMDANDHCPLGWVPYKDDRTCIKRKTFQPQSYKDARDHCKKYYRDLVSMTNDLKIAAVKKAVAHTKDPFWVGYVRDVAWALTYFLSVKESWNLPMKLTGFANSGFECVLLDWEFNTYRGTSCFTDHYYVCETYLPSGNWRLCEYGWSFYQRESVCVKVFDDVKKDFNKAIRDCRFQGADLVKMWNSEKFYFIREISSDKIKKQRLPLLIDMFLGDINGEMHFYLMDQTIINPIDPDTAEWADTALIDVMYSASEADQGCAVLGYRKTGIIKAHCSSVPLYIICEMPLAKKYTRCDANWFLYQAERMCIHAFPIKKYWFEAFNFCKVYNGRLVEIRSKEKLVFVQGVRGPNGDKIHWVGMNDVDTEGTLEYESGEKFIRRFVNAPAWTKPFEVTNTNQCIKTDALRKGYTAGSCDSSYYFICKKEL